MATLPEPPQSQQHPPGEIIRHDFGGWISGPSAEGTDQVPAEDVIPGDVLLIAAAEARVTGRRYGHFWLGGHLQAGVALDWDQIGGTARGTLFRLRTDLVDRISAGQVRQ